MTTLPNVPLPVAAPASPFPAAAAAPVLAYATGETIPTRVRFNTAHLTRTWGAWMGFLGLLALNIEVCVYAWWVIDGCYHDADDFIMHMFGLGSFGGGWDYWYYFGGGGPRPFGDVLADCTESNWPVVAFGIFFLLDGLLLFLLSIGVRRGSRFAAWVAILALLPVALVGLVATLTALSGAIFQNMTGGSPFFLLLLFPSALGILTLVLMIGIFRQLAWVIRNPDLERAPLHFWPRRRKNR